jgi:hypothetical protein
MKKSVQGSKENGRYSTGGTGDGEREVGEAGRQMERSVGPLLCPYNSINRVIDKQQLPKDYPHSMGGETQTITVLYSQTALRMEEGPFGP